MAAVFGLIVVANEAIAIFINDDSELAPIFRKYSFFSEPAFSEPAICNPDILTLEELDLCKSRGGVER